jgi:hypothetical protein
MATICMYRDFKIVSEGLRAAVVVIVLRVYFVGPSNRPSARGCRDARELNAPLRCRAASQLVATSLVLTFFFSQTEQVLPKYTAIILCFPLFYLKYICYPQNS